MLKVGLTGGIGSGKTTVSNLIKELGFPVYNSDSRAKWLMNNDPSTKNLVVLEFGESAYDKGVLNRKLISEIVNSIFLVSPELVIISSGIITLCYSFYLTLITLYCEAEVVTERPNSQDFLVLGC